MRGLTSPPLFVNGPRKARDRRTRDPTRSIECTPVGPTTRARRVNIQGHFTAAAKRLRAEHPPPARRSNGQFRPQRRKSRSSQIAALRHARSPSPTPVPCLHAPMAHQEDTCWRCGTQWATEDRPRTPLHVIPGGAPTDAVGRARAVNEARPATDRWVDEGGRAPFEAAAVLRATRTTPGARRSDRCR